MESLLYLAITVAVLTIATAARSRLRLSLIAIVVAAVGGLAGNLAVGNAPSLGIDLKGGVSVVLQPETEVTPDALDVAVEIIRARVDSIGVAEPDIRRQGGDIVVELPGVKDGERALALVGRPGFVELRPVAAVYAKPEAEEPAGTTTTTSSVAPAGSSSTVTSTTVTSSTVTSSTVPGGAGDDFCAGLRAEQEAGTEQNLYCGLASDPSVYVLAASDTQGDVFSNDAKADIFNGEWVVTVSLAEGAGTTQWNELAQACYYRDEARCPTGQLAIVLDGVVQSAPTVQEPFFSGGSVEISGAFTESEAKDLARILQFGAVNIKFASPSVDTVSATLGSESLRATVLAGLGGVLLVLLFLTLFYRLMGLIVLAGLLISGSLLWSVISLISGASGLALTLSGAAGIIVSVGVTVDSYVVLFEKMKDDLRGGRSLRSSAQHGFDRAWRTIVVADVVSLIGALVLWWLTVGSVRGFAFFLGLSTLCDLVVSYFYARPAVILLSRSKVMKGRAALGVRTAEVAQ